MTVGISRALCRELELDVGVSNVVGVKVYDSVAPRSADYPLVTVQQIHSEQARDQDGESGLEFNRIQVNAYETTPKLAKDLGDLVADAVGSKVGTTLGLTPHNIADLRSMFVVDHFQDVINPISGSDIPEAYVSRLELEAWHVPA